MAEDGKSAPAAGAPPVPKAEPGKAPAGAAEQQATQVKQPQRELTGAELKQQKQFESVASSVTSMVFPTHKPRDAAYGIKSGLYNVGSGICAGAAALVTAPMIGARQGGLKGFGQGLGAGLLMSVALPVAGVINGARQIGRGIANTVESIEARSNGKVWDSETESWVVFVPYNLADEAAKLKGTGGTSTSSAGGGGGGDSGGVDGGSATNRNRSGVKDMHHYDLLKVCSDATPGEVKKAYYKEARACHPDRNPGDAQASATFQALGEAYRVLSSDQLRAYYDKYGLEKDSKGGPDAEMQMDMAKMFFAVMFGGDKFEPYIGQLGLSAVVDVLTQEMQAAQLGQAAGGSSASKGIDLDEMKRTQTKREVTCAVSLAKHLQRFVEGDAKGFEMWCDEAVAGMAKATFGEPLLHAIGHAYSSAADKYLGFKEGFLGLEGLAAHVKEKASTNLAYMDVASKGFKSLGAMSRMQDIAEAAKLREAEDPLPPTAASLAATEAAYKALSVKELKEVCKGRQGPGSLKEGIPTASFVEKGDFVKALVADDDRRFKDLCSAHAAWKLGGCEGPPPARPKKKAKAPAAKPATQDKEEAAKAAGGGAEEPKAEGPLDDDGDEGGEEMKAAMEGSLPVFMAAMVAASLLDVEVTLKAVTRKVLDDHGVEEKARDDRARALRVLGAKMLSAKGTTKAARGEVDAKHVLEGTMLRTMAKAQGQEVDDDDEEMFERSANMAKADAQEGKEGKGGSFNPLGEGLGPDEAEVSQQEMADALRRAAMAERDKEEADAAAANAAVQTAERAEAAIKAKAAAAASAKEAAAKAVPSADDLD